MKLPRPKNIKRKILPYDKRQIVSPHDIPNLPIPLFTGVVPEHLDPIIRRANELKQPIALSLTAEEMDLLGGTSGWLPEPWGDEVLNALARNFSTTPVVLHLSKIKLLNRKDFKKIKDLLEFSIRGGFTSFEITLEPLLRNRWEKVFKNLYCAEELGWFIHTPEEPGIGPFIDHSETIYKELHKVIPKKPTYEKDDFKGIKALVNETTPDKWEGFKEAMETLATQVIASTPSPSSRGASKASEEGS